VNTRNLSPWLDRRRKIGTEISVTIGEIVERHEFRFADLRCSSGVIRHFNPGLESPRSPRLP
jgi:hypothetical protein